MDETLVSAVIPTWNSKELVVQCLESIYATTKELSLEVILVVNGSQDGTQATVQDRFPQVRSIDNRYNVGFTRATNMGIQRARGRYILLLNDDTIVVPGALEEMVRYLDEHPDVGAIGPQLISADGAKQHCIHNFPSLLTEIFPIALLQMLFPRTYPHKRIHYDDPVDVPAVLGACMMIRRDVIEAVGMLDEGYFAYLEETDWQRQFRGAGFRVVHLPNVHIYHLQGASSKKRMPGPSRVEYYRSLYRFYGKQYGTTICRLILVLKWFKLISTLVSLSLLCAATFLRKERPKNRLKSYVYLFRWHLKGRPPEMGLSRPEAA
jgi:GT2 family glycosyltransferase